MTRLGWVVLALVVVVVGGFLSLVRFGGGPGAIRPTPQVTRPDEQAVGPGLLAVPVRGIPRGALRDSWGDARSEGRQHHGTDIMAAGGTLVTAAAPGRIEKLFQSARGGITLYVRSPARRWTYYYAHLAGYAPGVHEGQAVRAGDPLGFVGDTGDAGPGNYHLHFGLTRTSPAQHWYEGEDVNPFPFLAGTPRRR